MRSLGYFPAMKKQEKLLTDEQSNGLRQLGENLTNCHRETKVTAPVLDSTSNTPGETAPLHFAPLVRGRSPLAHPRARLSLPQDPPP
jgi:hypothetical protein